MSEETGFRVAFVTGAASGIGQAAAGALAAAGYAVVLADREAEAGRQAAARLGGGADHLFLNCDVTDEASVAAALVATMKRYGRLNAAFNAAGITGPPHPTAEYPEDVWSRVIAVNLTGVWRCMRHQIGAMLKTGGGSIVNCASVAGLVGAPQLAPYVASKHGVVGLTRTAALEYARQGVRVNAICPGMVDTPMTQASIPPEFKASLSEASPIGRFAEPSEIASAVLWLLDPASSFVTGQAIAVDGGWTAQ